ncbi:MAG: hypothetical protein SOZ01_00525 [Selenomonadaceae bacterium]|jgi:hypothetical protein|nr:hypothetical protein [Selenomonadaceae bacterium]MDD7056950.1 hypothetical protein [Selenomonadaceae bacterium]MDY3915217.1 hypothetical protein [Selenomonadaceae bacterium]
MQKKGMASLALAVVLGVGAQFVNPVCITSTQTPVVGLQSAEAFGLGGMKDVAKKAGKQAVSSQFNIDLDSMSNKKQDMLLNLVKASYCEQYSAVQLHTLVNDPDIAKWTADLKQKQALLGNAGSLTPKTLEGMKTSLAGSIETKDQATKMADLINKMQDSEITEQTKGLQHNAKVSRTRAAFYNALALRDATMIIGQSTKALAKPSDLGDKVGTVKELMAYAQAAKSLLDEQKQASKVRAQLQKAADKRFKDAGKVTKDEEQAFDKQMGLAQ